MSVQFDEAASKHLLPGDSQTIHIRRNDVTLPTGETGVTEYASQGTGLGVIIIPMTTGPNRLLTRRFRHPVGRQLWEFPRAIVQKISVTEAESILLQETGLSATCRLIGTLAPDSGALNTTYGVYEAFIDVDPSVDGLPPVRSSSDSESMWFNEENFARQVRNSELNDSLTLSAIAMQYIETATSNF